MPYSIVDGWQQIRKDFGYWRADVVGIRTSTDPAERAWFEADLKLREKLTLRDIGIWSHYVGDASQPLHVSVHFNGWGNYPNPNSYTTSTALHAHFEGEFVKQYLDRIAVAQALIPYQDCRCGIEAKVKTLLFARQGMVVPLYEL